MIILLSPAKIQHFSPQPVLKTASQAVFLKEAEELVGRLRELPASELSKLLQINRNLTQLNLDRMLQWQLPFSLENARQAVLVFDGEAFRGLNAKSFTAGDLDFAQQHLRILSGLYGVLRPLDLIQLYRLEVSSKLKNDAGKDLYPFWKEKVHNFLRNEIKKSGDFPCILNLASSEYFSMTGFRNDDIPVLDVEFYQYQHDTLRQVVIYTKKARGMLARYAITHRITNPDDLKGFDAEGYWFDPQQSTDRKLVFVR